MQCTLQQDSTFVFSGIMLKNYNAFFSEPKYKKISILTSKPIKMITGNQDDWIK